MSILFYFIYYFDIFLVFSLLYNVFLVEAPYRSLGSCILIKIILDLHLYIYIYIYVYLLLLVYKTFGYL